MWIFVLPKFPCQNFAVNSLAGRRWGKCLPLFSLARHLKIHKSYRDRSHSTSEIHGTMEKSLRRKKVPARQSWRPKERVPVNRQSIALRRDIECPGLFDRFFDWRRPQICRRTLLGSLLGEICRVCHPRHYRDNRRRALENRSHNGSPGFGSLRAGAAPRNIRAARHASFFRARSPGQSVSHCQRACSIWLSMGTGNRIQSVLR